MAKKNHINEDIHSQDLRDLLDKPPTWLSKGGLFLILFTIVMICSLSIFIRYPEIVHAQLKFNIEKDEYYGEILIPKHASSKVKEKQDVLIKVQSYPHQEYGYLKGKVDYISDILVNDSLLFSRVTLLSTDQDSVIKLKPGIIANAEIITENRSIFKRIWLNLTNSLKF